MSEIKANFKGSLAYLFFRNPVLVLGLVIGQLAAGDTTLQNGAALSVAYFLIVVPVLVFASAIGKKLPDWSKVVCYALLSAAMLVPSYFVCGTISATIFDSLGIYPALLAVSTVPVVYSYKVAEKQSVSAAAFNGLCLFLGFAITAIILGAAREFLGSGSLWGFKIAKASLPAAKLPFWGFILLGFMAAIINWIKDIFKRPEDSSAGEEESL
jgi:Na+-translocating ferredoxin:NAD+ oxidoreductase RnfE subunit